jgi:hypothetical protein
MIITKKHTEKTFKDIKRGDELFIVFNDKDAELRHIPVAFPRLDGNMFKIIQAIAQENFSQLKIGIHISCPLEPELDMIVSEKDDVYFSYIGAKNDVLEKLKNIELKEKISDDEDIFEFTLSNLKLDDFMKNLKSSKDPEVAKLVDSVAKTIKELFNP